MVDFSSVGHLSSSNVWVGVGRRAVHLHREGSQEAAGGPHSVPGGASQHRQGSRVRALAQPGVLTYPPPLQPTFFCCQNEPSYNPSMFIHALNLPLTDARSCCKGTRSRQHTLSSRNKPKIEFECLTQSALPAGLLYGSRNIISIDDALLAKECQLVHKARRVLPFQSDHTGPLKSSHINRLYR